MISLYRQLLRPVLFTQPPEVIHEFTLAALAWTGRHRWLRRLASASCGAAALPVRCMGLDFPNPVGLAAGMDKDGVAVPAWSALGFGFTELGAVTAQPQPGNPPPRLFRAIADGAIVNRMGFNNAGAAALADRLAAWRAAGHWPAHPVGVNLGKTKVTPLERAPEDYAESLRQLLPQADFFVVNVSSPNTPNLRQLQDKPALDELLSALQAVQTGPAPKPILVKIAPDLTWGALDDILELGLARRIAGLVATNTTLTRPETADPQLRRVYAETGGLSGRPLRARSTEVIAYLYRQSAGKVPIIGVGGIFSADDAWEKITAGASLVQVYTGLVFEGPWLVRGIVSGLRARLAQAGLARLSEAVGLGQRGAV